MGALVWGVVGILPVLRKTLKSPAQWTFVLFAISVSVYCILDMLNLLSSTGEQTLLFVKARGVTLTVSALLLLVSAKWLTFERKRSDFLLVVPAGALAVLAWSFMTVSVIAADGGFVAERDLTFYGPWLLYLHAYVIAGLYYLVRGLKNLPKEYPSDRGKAISLLITVAVIILFSHPGRIVPGVLEVRAVPLSSLLFIPGAATLVFLMPITRESLTHFVRRVTRSNDEILHTFLVYHGGSLIASRSLEGQSVPDEDIFSAVLEAIQTFIKVTIPPFGRGWLDAIDHGDLKILTERGEYCLLVLVTTGREDDLLRGEMRDVLGRFEERNAEVLVEWQGDPDNLSGHEDVVSFFFDLNRVF